MTDAAAARTALYGVLPPALAEQPAGAVQLSPTRPGSNAIEDLDEASLSEIAIAAPAGSLERRAVLAHALRALEPGGRLLALAPKDRGGARLATELAALGCPVSERSKAHHRICEGVRPAGTLPVRKAIEQGGPAFLPNLGLWSQPGVFSFDRVDPGSAFLIEHLPALFGRGADLGCGVGVLARAVLSGAGVTHLDLIEIDRRALACARRNVEDARAAFHWADARDVRLRDLDFVVSNPPFHAEGEETRALGQAFIRAGATMLRKGGRLLLVANRHLPYEAVLRTAFARSATIAEGSGFKVFEAVK